MAETKTAKRLTGGIIAIIVLAVCLCITTFALVYASVSVENNLFHTGEIKINLNDGKPVIQEHEFIFEPGMTVVKDFFIENDSTWDVYYRLYLDNVSGGLADVLTVTIKDGDKTLYSGTANELTRQNVVAADDTLKIGQRRNLIVIFHYRRCGGAAYAYCEIRCQGALGGFAMCGCRASAGIQRPDLRQRLDL